MQTDFDDKIYDIETVINVFTMGINDAKTGERWVFEVSDRRDDRDQINQAMAYMGSAGSRMFGFNNEGFDYLVLHHLMDIVSTRGSFDPIDAYDKAQEIIDPKTRAMAYQLCELAYGAGMNLEAAYRLLHSPEAKHDLKTALTPIAGVQAGDLAQQLAYTQVTTPRDNRFGLMVWQNQRRVIQGDLYKIHHFDNRNRATSLKAIEIALRMPNVVDMPHSPHDPHTSGQIDELLTYMDNDVHATQLFYERSTPQINFRDELARKNPGLGDVLNFNDTKIGKQFFIQELERAIPGSCYHRVNGQKKPRQTLRPTIALGEVISPKIVFQSPAFQAIVDRLRSSVIVETKGVFDDMKTRFDGMDFVFGLGGLHGSLLAQSVYADDTYDLIDVDVASYYPNIAIKGGYFPEHLSEDFCRVYQQVYDMRKEHAKGTVENEMLKLALNGVYGDSGSSFSPFYDTKYMMSTTINGQLSLCMLAEWVVTHCGAKMVQANTDGITCLVPKTHRAAFMQMCAHWEAHTELTLEYADYSAMHLRDVNSYMAVKAKGGVKRIGAYAYETVLENPSTRELQWNKNHSKRIVAMAAEAYLVRGVPLLETIQGSRDPYDFMISVKVPRNFQLAEQWPDQPPMRVQNTCRYYVSTVGCALVKLMPPLKDKTQWRTNGIEKGWTVRVVNDASHFDWNTVNWLYYLEEAKKLTSWQN